VACLFCVCVCVCVCEHCEERTYKTPPTSGMLLAPLARVPTKTPRLSLVCCAPLCIPGGCVCAPFLTGDCPVGPFLRPTVPGVGVQPASDWRATGAAGTAWGRRWWCIRLQHDVTRSFQWGRGQRGWSDHQCSSGSGPWRGGRRAGCEFLVVVHSTRLVPQEGASARLL
jgi:hypothetical protein